MALAVALHLRGFVEYLPPGTLLGVVAINFLAVERIR